MEIKNKEAQIAVVDLGSQYTEIIRRSLRYLGFSSVILSPNETLEWVRQNHPKGIILSGGSASVYDADAPKIPEEILELKIPIFGICFGMQWLAYISDRNAVHQVKEGKSYGPVEVEVGENTKSHLFQNVGKKIKAWSSHGDSVKIAPAGFQIVATSKDGSVIEAMEDSSRKFYGVQFHPEVEQTEDDNQILLNFVEKICGCEKDYSKSDVIKEIRENTEKELGPDGIAIIGVSGGVDSTTLAAILSPVLGNRLKAFMIDTGGMREGEVEAVLKIAQKAKIPLEIITKYKERFIEEIGKTIDAEEKRAKFRQVYGEVFREVAKSYDATHMIQGTLATDLIESGSKGGSAMIKTHHNVDLDLGLKEIMPLSDYFKFEIRELASEFGLEELVAKRQPFPGPGLFLRIVGVPITSELLEIVRDADTSVKNILQKHGVYEMISQTIVSLLGVKTVGVKGDGRVYGYAMAVRTVETVDFMTAKGFYLNKEICEEIVASLTSHREIVRVFFDFTPKPPATMEYE
ncbi:MAG TPA: glutamine-hydrolyzing GMP synthase [Candidatus Paceibacterota bacterium]|nr:glutamine-hydrolyzing GMP synthase [Candidatus Paceibacterota bacterium]